MLLRQASMAVASCLMVTACQAGFSPDSSNLEDDTEQAASALTAGSTRYVSPDGDDANDGRTARRAAEQSHVHFHRGITARVETFARLNVLNLGHSSIALGTRERAAGSFASLDFQILKARA